jgi:hypothetical protein
MLSWSLSQRLDMAVWNNNTLVINYFLFELKPLLEITPNTEASRIVMMLMIILALAVLPGLLSDVSETIRKHKGKHISGSYNLDLVFACDIGFTGLNYIFFRW